MGDESPRRPVVLFLCTGNSARSQMAEALLRKFAAEQFEVHSAGLDPQGIHPCTERVMNEIGISLDGQRSKSLAEYLGKLPVSYAVFVCEQAESRCPTNWPFCPQRLYWPFDDPAAFSGSEEDRLEKFRQVRDEIEDKLRSWLDGLGITPNDSPAA